MRDRSRQAKLAELTREECLALIASHSFGRVAVGGSAETPIVRPVNYVFDRRSQAVAFRTVAGSKLHFLVRAGKAAFEIDGVDHETRTGWSVIIAGITEEVSDAAEVRRLEGLALETWPAGELSHWVRVRAATVTGRRIAAGGSS